MRVIDRKCDCRTRSHPWFSCRASQLLYLHKSSASLPTGVQQIKPLETPPALKNSKRSGKFAKPATFHRQTALPLKVMFILVNLFVTLPLILLGTRMYAFALRALTPEQREQFRHGMTKEGVHIKLAALMLIIGIGSLLLCVTQFGNRVLMVCGGISFALLIFGRHYYFEKACSNGEAIRFSRNGTALMLLAILSFVGSIIIGQQ